MKKTTKAFIFLSSASFVIAGLGLAACSSSTTTIIDDAGGGGGDSTTGDGGGGGDSAMGNDTGMGNDSMVAADCKSATLHSVDAAAGPYCPFFGTAPGSNCPIGTLAAPAWCCKTSTGDGRCVNAAANPCMAMEVALECDDDTNCKDPLAPKCCGVGTVKQDPTCAGTTAYFASGFNSTKCQASCAAGELQMCTSPTECADAAAPTCIAFKARGGQFGACVAP